MILKMKQKHQIKLFKLNVKYFTGTYESYHRESIDPKTREAFWKKQAEEISWFNFPTEILNSRNPPFYRWFSDGKINMTYNCLDRHVKEGRGKNRALIWESAYSQKVKEYTYEEMTKEVSKLSKILKEKFSLQKGDRVIIYMPNIPEAVISMLACARLGVIHSVVFGGFAAEELSIRIHDCKPKLIITSSLGIEPKKKIPYFPIVKEALELEKLNGRIPILLHQREDFYVENNFAKEDNTHIYQEEMSKLTDYEQPSEVLNSNDPLYILYTSGTTGSPKGICRDIGGTCVALNWAMKNIMDIDQFEVYFATSDIGWVVGHSFMVYAPLLRAATSLLFEGKPIGTPHCGKFWELAQKHKVKSMFTSPTALRAIKKEDSDGKVFSTYDLSYMKCLHVAGERCDSETIHWVRNVLGQDRLINDNWWQTETGWPMSSNNMRIETFPVVPGSTCKPVPGYDVRIVDEETEKEIKTPNTLGRIYCKLPMPPSFMLSLWGSDKAFVEKYISKDGQYYITGDAGYINDKGYLFIDTRIDDIINVAGHRLSTGRIEEVINQVDEIVESAVVAYKDEVKGEIPFAFAICNICNTFCTNEEEKAVKDKAKAQVATHIGAISRLKDVIIIHRLPKTRSGKILRGVLKKILNKEAYKVPSTIEDDSVIDEIIHKLKLEKYL